MCGIAGYIRSRGLLSADVERAMAAAIHHRGPDGTGEWVDPVNGIALVHARLKVLDLTEAAHQPMRSNDGSTILIFNGEIYNYQELRAELLQQGVSFHGTGDTEVLLEFCRRDPELGFLPRLAGMFAFAVWHVPSRTLRLVRDRTGVKPLLYGALEGGGIAFASEMAAVRPALGALTIDPFAVMQLLALGFIAAPRTIFHQVRKLPPGHLATVHDGQLVVHRWAPEWPPSQSPPMTDFAAACRDVRDTLDVAVRQRLLADVPVGLFLSGGIDSGVVTAVAARVAGRQVKTFSVSFPDQPFYDESRYAYDVARMHGTEHTVLPLSLDDVRNVIPIVQSHLGEPFADSSALPTYLLSQLTRKHVTVALSGDGADELFAGYARYTAATLNQRLGWFAKTPLYGLSRSIVERLPARREKWIGAKVSQLKRALRAMDRDPLRRYANWMRTCDDRTLARLLSEPHRASLVAHELGQMLFSYRGRYGGGEDLNLHLRTEWQTSLPDDMLTKVDLMSMAHALEVRSPFLDHRLVERVFPMPAEWKLKGFHKKHLLIEAFRDLLPKSLHNRPKKGFEVPVGPWLRGPLNKMARDLIENDTLFFGPLLSREGALKTLSDHSTGRADHNFHLWALISLLSWQQQHAPTVSIGEWG